MCDGAVFGVNDNYDLTDDLAEFLALNHTIINRRIPIISRKLVDYRHHYAQLFKKKADTLSYQFLMRVHNCPQDPAALAKAVAAQEPDIRVRQLLAGCDIVFQTTYERLAAVLTTQVAAWWYIF